MSHSRSHRPWGILASGIGASLVLAACGSSVELEPAPEASDPVCARVLINMPDELSGAEKRSTTTQASRAWGDPPITIRCGVEPPGPTTDRCVTAIDASGRSIDWVMREIGDQGVDENTWHFTTYGRTPAIEVVVPVEYAGTDATDVLGILGESIAQIPATRECV